MDYQAITHFIFNELSPWEVVAVIFALLYVFLASYENIWCWAAALVSTSIYVGICFNAQLYLETFLQVFYIIMAVYGWYEWKYGTKENKDNLPITSFPLRKLGLLLLAGAISTIISGYLFDRFFGSANPYLDATTTIFAFIATWMVARKFIENWILWIVIDFLSIFLYASRELYLSSGLYLFYTLIAIFGYYKWKQLMQRQEHRFAG